MMQLGSRGHHMRHDPFLAQEHLKFQKRAKIPDQPKEDTPGRTMVMIIPPPNMCKHRQLIRAWMNTDTVGNLYDFIKYECADLFGDDFLIVRGTDEEELDD